MTVKVDASDALEMIDEVSAVIDGDKALMRYGAAILQHETDRAFAAGVDPETSRPWPSRMGDYPWPILQHTRTLRSALTTGWGVKTKRGGPKLFGKVRDGFYLGSYGGGKGPKPIMVVVGSVHFGRTKGRTGSGSKIFSRGPLTGRTPPRPLFGLSSSAQRRFAERAERLINKAAK